MHQEPVSPEMRSLLAFLPAEVAATARERGRVLDLWATAESLLAMLSD
jgi:hypothetical protein